MEEKIKVQLPSRPISKQKTNKQTNILKQTTLQINSSHSFLQFALMASKRLILSTDHDRTSSYISYSFRAEAE